MPDLSVNRSPSGWRRLLKTRVRRLTGRLQRDDPEQYRATLASIATVATHALAQHDADQEQR